MQSVLEVFTVHQKPKFCAEFCDNSTSTSGLLPSGDLEPDLLKAYILNSCMDLKHMGMWDVGWDVQGPHMAR